MRSILNLLPLFLIVSTIVSCNKYSEIHVSPIGTDSNTGTLDEPLKTISAAARIAQPGDTITVHSGIYREYINPVTGGLSDKKRIVYRAAKGEEVVIKGSEHIESWEFVENDTWMTIIPNAIFGDFNPFRDTICGDWFISRGRTHHTGAVYLNGHWLTESANKDKLLEPAGNGVLLWFAKSDIKEDGSTIIWAQFPDTNPNNEHVEINVRQSVFYPQNTGVNYITVDGFIMEHAATPWSPPTAEQIGLIGTNWSKGWKIINNTIRYSTCVGITLGKYGDEFDNTSQNSAEGYVKTIERATASGWSKDNIGSHEVINNEISHCEQAGLVGSMGAVFSKINLNNIHDIHIRRLFTGHEMAGIKIHGAIECEINDNHIFKCIRGIWLDWMTQGTRVSGNLLHDNGPNEDVFLEMNHGPVLLDNNICLSDNSLKINSQGAAYVHNLFAGSIQVLTGDKRLTPYLEANSTIVAGLLPNQGGDERYYNNIFAYKADLSAYDRVKYPVLASGNIFAAGSSPGKYEKNATISDSFDPGLSIENVEGKYWLSIGYDLKWLESINSSLITSEKLGTVVSNDLPFVHVDGKEYKIDNTYFIPNREEESPAPGPFITLYPGRAKFIVWPKEY